MTDVGQTPRNHKDGLPAAAEHVIRCGCLGPRVSSPPGPDGSRALHRPYRLRRDRCRLPLEPIGSLLVSGVITPHGFGVAVVVLQGGDEERNVIVGNIEFHSGFILAAGEATLDWLPRRGAQRFSAPRSQGN